MALTTAYMAKVNNLEEMLDTIQNAQAPDRFTQRFLADLGFTSSNDRALINMLKGLGFLDENGSPKQRYYDFLDESHSRQILAQGIREAYGDLFRVNNKANEMNATDVKNKLKTLLQGSKGESVLRKMATTFVALSELGDFEATPIETTATVGNQATPSFDENGSSKSLRDEAAPTPAIVSNGPNLRYSINIELPATRDKHVYDAIFKSIRENLM